MPHFPLNPPSHDRFDFTTETRGQEAGVSLTAVQPSSEVPVDLELVLLNDVSGNVADTKYDLNSESPKTEDGSGISLETHINATWTVNESMGEPRYDEFATYSNSTSDAAQADWLAFG